MLYCFYIVAFEFLFLRCQAHLVEECPQEMVGTMVTYQYAAMYSAMLLVTGRRRGSCGARSARHRPRMRVLYLLLRATIVFDGRRIVMNPSQAD